LTQLVERAGNGADETGSITAFYTVLTDADDNSDPIAESARAILDGHIVLSRKLAEAGHFPAIDIEASVSRAMTQITDPAHQRMAKRFRQYYSLFEQNRDLLNVGAYQAGQNPQLDQAIAINPQLQDFLRQDMHAKVSMDACLKELALSMSSLAKQDQSVARGADGSI
jgi:flagellum-specific ATP synthase